MPGLLRLSFIVLMALCALGGSARAEDPPLGKPKDRVALEHLARGNNLYKVRSFEEAATEYKAGAVIEPAPIFDYNLGQCYRQLGKYEEAIWHYQQFVKTSPSTSEHNRAVENFIAQMKAELEKKAMTVPPIDAAPAASESVVSPVPAEQHDELTSPVDHRPSPWYSDRVGWGLTGVGVAGLAVSGALLLNAESLRDDAAGATSQREQNSLYDKANSRSLVGTIVGVGGVGLLVAGIAKLALHADSADEVTATTWNVGVSSRGVSVSGRF